LGLGRRGEGIGKGGVEKKWLVEALRGNSKRRGKTDGIYKGLGLRTKGLQGKTPGKI